MYLVGGVRGGRLVQSVGVAPLDKVPGEVEFVPSPDPLVPLLLLLPWELPRECLELGDVHSTPVSGGNSSAFCGFLHTCTCHVF